MMDVAEQEQSETKCLVMIMGPSCAGKSVLERALASRPEFSRIIGFTTREQRPREIDGLDYDFVSESEAAGIVREMDYVEQEKVAGAHYGATRARFNQAMRDGIPVVVCDPKGCDTYQSYCRANGITPIQIFVSAPAELLIARWLSRFAEETSKGEVLNKYAQRIRQTVECEVDWSRGRSIDLTFFGLGETMTLDFAVGQIVELVDKTRRVKRAG